MQEAAEVMKPSPNQEAEAVQLRKTLSDVRQRLEKALRSGK